MLNPSSQNSWFLSQFLNCHWYSARIFYGRFSCTHMNALNSEEEDIYRSGHGVWVWTLWLAWGDIVWETLMSLYLMCLSRRKSCLCVLLQNLCYGPYLSRVLKLSRQEPDLLLRLILSVLYFSSSPSFFFFFPLRALLKEGEFLNYRHYLPSSFLLERSHPWIHCFLDLLSVSRMPVIYPGFLTIFCGFSSPESDALGPVTPVTAQASLLLLAFVICGGVCFLTGVPQS